MPFWSMCVSPCCTNGTCVPVVSVPGTHVARRSTVLLQEEVQTPVEQARVVHPTLVGALAGLLAGWCGLVTDPSSIVFGAGVSFFTEAGVAPAAAVAPAELGVALTLCLLPLQARLPWLPQSTMWLPPTAEADLAEKLALVGSCLVCLTLPRACVDLHFFCSSAHGLCQSRCSCLVLACRWLGHWGCESGSPPRCFCYCRRVAAFSGTSVMDRVCVHMFLMR